jgi:hypothetical protein
MPNAYISLNICQGNQSLDWQWANQQCIANMHRSLDTMQLVIQKDQKLSLN